MTNEQLYLDAKTAYYAGHPIMSDSEFDILESILKKENSELINMVGSETSGKIKHESAMLSLAKISVYDNQNLPIDEISKWLDTCKGSNHFEFSTKLDGNAINLIYKKGVLTHAISRGDGHFGYDIVDKLKHIVPNRISETSTVEIRGEVVINILTFNEKYSNFKNPRNFVAGMLNRDDNDIQIIKDLHFGAFEVRIHGDDNYYFPENTQNFLTSNNFNYPETKLLTDVKNLNDLYTYFLNFRETTTEFQLDGIVIKAEEKCRLDLGSTDHHPKWAIAIKFPPKDAITEIVDIQWKTGISGEIVPTAIMKPIDLDGSTVTRATLFNWGRVRDWKAFPGAEVLIAKAGDIIPQIYQVIKPSTLEIKPPSHCPSCNSITRIDDLHIWCDNNECYSKIISQLCSAIKIFKVENIGQSAVEKFYEAGFRKITQIFDRSLFNENLLIKSGIFKKGRHLEIILNSIYNLKEVSLSQIILACQYDQIGNAAAEKLAFHLSGHPVDFSGLNRSAISNVINDSSSINELVEMFEKSNITVIRPSAKENQENIEKYELTGSPKDCNYLVKSDFIKFANSVGFKHSKIEKNTKYLITDSLESNSSKMQKALKLGIEIITYSDFVKKYKA